MLKITNVSKSYCDKKILENISISVDKSHIIGLAGPSGGGKSTLLRCIQKLEKVDSGSIECDGKIGFMFQDFQLFPHMTVLQNLMYAPNIHNKTDNNEKLALQLLEKLGVADKTNAYPEQLSGGQKQRVALARSLMMNPDLLLCDEPTSGLDVATTLDIVTLLKSIQEMGITMIIASHDLDFLTKIADKIILLKDGEIAVTVEPQNIDDPITQLKQYY